MNMLLYVAGVTEYNNMQIFIKKGSDVRKVSFPEDKANVKAAVYRIHVCSSHYIIEKHTKSSCSKNK